MLYIVCFGDGRGKEEKDDDILERVGMTKHAIDTEDRPNELRFVITKSEEAGFFAVCVEHYIGAQGRTVEEATNRLRIAYRADLDESMRRTGKPFGSIQAAPEKYEIMFKKNDECVLRGTIYDSRPHDLVQLAA